METVALGFVKNNPWVQIDRAKRIMLKDSEQSSKYFNGISAEFNKNKIFADDAENRNEVFVDEELEYGPGFVEKLKNRYLQLVASTAANENLVEFSSTASSTNTTKNRNKYKVYGRRTASCDDLMSDGPLSPQRKMSGPQKSQSTLNVFKPKILVPMTQTVSIESPPSIPSVPIPSTAVHPVPGPTVHQSAIVIHQQSTVYQSEYSVNDQNTQSVSSLKGKFETKQKFRSTSSEDSSNRDSFDNDVEAVPEFLKKIKTLKHVDKPLEATPASLLPPEPYVSRPTVCYDAPHPEPNHQRHQIDAFQKDAQIEQKSDDFVDFAKTSKISNFSSENEIKSFLKNNFDDNGPKILPKATISVTENVLDSSHLKPVNDKDQTRIPSPVPSLSEMKDLLEKFQVQRKQRENETETEKISSKTNKNGENLKTNKKSDENLLNFDIYDGLEQNFSTDADQKPPAVGGGGQRKSLSAQFKKQIQETNGNEPVSSLMDQDISSHPSTAAVLQPTTVAESEKVDFNPSVSKNGFHTVATYMNPVSTSGRIVSNGYGVINGDDPLDDDDDDDVDALLNGDNDDDNGPSFEFIGAYVKLEKSSIASSSHKLKAAVEFKTDSPRAYAYVEELDAEESGDWLQGTELNYKEYKEMCDRMRQDKFRKSYLPSNQDNKVQIVSSSSGGENDKILNSGHLANFTPTHLKSTDYNLGSTLVEDVQPSVVIKNDAQADTVENDSNLDEDQNGSFYGDNSVDLLF